MGHYPWTSSSGEAFAELLTDRLLGVPGVRVAVRQIDPAISTQASFMVDVSWQGQEGVLCEVADAVDGARVMDSHGEDVSIEAALRYIEARASGRSPEQAWRYAEKNEDP